LLDITSLTKTIFPIISNPVITIPQLHQEIMIITGIREIKIIIITRWQVHHILTTIIIHKTKATNNYTKNSDKILVRVEPKIQLITKQIKLHLLPIHLLKDNAKVLTGR